MDEEHTIRSASLTARVKERDEVDRCRHCARPTWSLRRCCVPCKRAGRTGPGTIASLRSGRTAGLRILAVGCFWGAHVAAVVVFGSMLLLGMGQRIQAGDVREILLFAVFESTLDGIGFVLAILFSPRPAAGLRLRYFLLAAITGVACTVLTSGILIGIRPDDAIPTQFLFAGPVVLTAVVARVSLSASFATRLLEADAGERVCPACGTQPDRPDDPFCTACGEPR